MASGSLVLREQAYVWGHLPGIGLLRALLETGWQIESPVRARLSWSQRYSGELAYHVILSQQARRSLVVIGDSPALHRFFAEHAIVVAS